MRSQGIDRPVAIAPEAVSAGTRYVSVIADEVELVDLSRARPAQPRGWLLAVGVVVVAAAMVVGLVEVGVVSIGPSPEKPASIAALLASPALSSTTPSPSTVPVTAAAPVLPASTAARSANTSASPADSPTPTPTPAPVIVVVAAGDSLSGIAARYGVPLAQLLTANPQVADPSLIHVGDRITVPPVLVNRLVGGTHDPVPAWVAGTPKACYAYGWAFDPNDRTVDVIVRILIDGKVRVSVVANEYREDLAQFAIGGDGTAAFSVDLSKLLAPDVVHQIRVQAQDLQSGEWVDLNNTPRELICAKAEG